MIKFYGFERLARQCPSDVPAWDQEFYTTYAEALLKKRKGTVQKLLDEVKISGKMVQFHVSVINQILGTKGDSNSYYKHSINIVLEALKGWLSPLIYDFSPQWMVEGVSIEKKDMNITSKYWFGFISSTIIPS